MGSNLYESTTWGGGAGPELPPTPFSDQNPRVKNLRGAKVLNSMVFAKKIGENFGSHPKALWKVQTPYQSAVGESGLISELPLELRTFGGAKVLVSRFLQTISERLGSRSTT